MYITTTLKVVMQVILSWKVLLSDSTVEKVARHGIYLSDCFFSSG